MDIGTRESQTCPYIFRNMCLYLIYKHICGHVSHICTCVLFVFELTFKTMIWYLMFLLSVVLLLFLIYHFSGRYFVSSADETPPDWSKPLWSSLRFVRRISVVLPSVRGWSFSQPQRDEGGEHPGWVTNENDKIWWVERELVLVKPYLFTTHFLKDTELSQNELSGLKCLHD